MTKGVASVYAGTRPSACACHQSICSNSWPHEKSQVDADGTQELVINCTTVVGALLHHPESWKPARPGPCDIQLVDHHWLVHSSRYDPRIVMISYSRARSRQFANVDTFDHLAVFTL